MKTLQQRFDAKWRLELESGCHVWTATKTPGGKGMIRDGNKLRKASWVSYELHRGPVPAGCKVGHTCGDLGCVNPGHLRVF